MEIMGNVEMEEIPDFMKTMDFMKIMDFMEIMDFMKTMDFKKISNGGAKFQRSGGGIPAPPEYPPFQGGGPWTPAGWGTSYYVAPAAGVPQPR